MQLTHFTVTNYWNVLDSGWIEINGITAFVGQNEAGKSNLFEALYRINPFAPDEAYNIDEDWPVGDWGNMPRVVRHHLMQAIDVYGGREVSHFRTSH